MTDMTTRKQLEYVGITIPGKGKRIGQIAIGPYEKEEEIFRKISTIVGTQFRLAGIDYEVVCSEPFKLVQLTQGQEPFKLKSRGPEVTESVFAEDTLVVEDQSEAKVETTAVTTPQKPSVRVAGPAVGERWRPRDPRRVASFTIVKIEGETVFTDDGRTVKLDRFKRYERVSN